MADVQGKVEWTCDDCGQSYLVPVALYNQLEGDGMAYCPRCADDNLEAKE
jgi:hypothetical protein